MSKKSLNNDDDETMITKTNVIVVLGAPTTAEGEPGPDLKQRLDRCLELMRREMSGMPREGKNTKTLIAVTGGSPRTYGSSGVCTEASCMKKYLLEHGGGGGGGDEDGAGVVNNDNIIVEDRAIHTFHNALYVKTLLKERGILPPVVIHEKKDMEEGKERPPAAGVAALLPVVNLVILTTDWHMERSMLCFKAVYSDMMNVVITLTPEAVPSDPSDPQVIERIEKEKRLLKRGWISLCLVEEKDHPDMPAKQNSLRSTPSNRQKEPGSATEA